MGSLTTATTAIDWSSLPDEIWSAIGVHLADDRFDATRFRSVCTSFRSLLPKFSPSSSLPRFSFSLFRPSSSTDAFVSLTTVYKISRPHGADAWIVKVDSSSSDRICLLDSLSCRRISDISSLAGFRLSDFQISELARAYSLRDVRGSSSIAGIDKLVLSPTAAANVVFVIYDGGRLGFAGDGDWKITPIESRVVDYNDITVFRGQPYVVDRWGTVSWIDASMRLVQYSPHMVGDEARKHLVVSSGELFVVERYLDESYTSNNDQSLSDFNIFRRHHHRRRRLEFTHSKTVNFKVFKLDEEWGKWDEVKSLGKKSFVLTYDCSFSISVDEFDGFEPNRIYFTEQFNLDFALRRLGRQGGCVFNMEDGVIEDLEITPGYLNIFQQRV